MSASLRAAFDDPQSPAGRLRAGQVLLLLSSVITASTVYALHPARDVVQTLLPVGAALLAVVVLSPCLPWLNGGVRRALVFPVCLLAGLLVFGLADHHTAVAYAGLIVFCFVYVGLTQPPGTSLLLLPAAMGCWLVLQGAWSSTLAVRLLIGVSVWITVGELLSRRTEREAAATRHLRRRAESDSLTGVVNRRGLTRKLLDVTVGDTVVMCDLDHFKAVNDLLGHDAGDQVLRDFGALLRASLRGQDLAARYGGEEFLLLLAGTSPEAALDVLSRMRAQWAQLQPDVTFSSGIAVVTDALPVAAAITAADEALYASKGAGRNCDHIAYQQIIRASLSSAGGSH